MSYAVESLFQVYDVDEAFLVIMFYAFSNICLIVKSHSTVVLPGLYPASSSSPSALSTYCFILFCINLVKAFSGIICKLMPLQFLQYCGSPFLCYIETIVDFVKSSGMSSSSWLFVTRACMTL